MLHITATPSLSIFRCRLKSHLFLLFYPTSWLFRLILDAIIIITLHYMVASLTWCVTSIFVMIMRSGHVWCRRRPKYWKWLWNDSMSSFIKTCLIHTLHHRVNCGSTLHRWTMTQRPGRKRWNMQYYLADMLLLMFVISQHCCASSLAWWYFILCGWQVTYMWYNSTSSALYEKFFPAFILSSSKVYTPWGTSIY